MKERKRGVLFVEAIAICKGGDRGTAQQPLAYIDT